METWLAKSEEISFLELDMHIIGKQYSLGIRVGPTEDVRVFVLEIQPICAEYELDTWLALSNVIRVYETDI